MTKMINRAPHEEFYRTKPDYRTLFPFGCIGSLRWTWDGTHKQTNFEPQCMMGITLGCNEYTTVFYNPEINRFCTSADYVLGKRRLIGEIFPSIWYDGGLTTSILMNKNDGPPTYDSRDLVFFQCQLSYTV